MNKAISETKIRSVVRQELRSFLIGEGLWSTGLNVLRTAAGFKLGDEQIKKAGKFTQADYDAFVGRPAAPPAPPAPSPEFKELDGMFKAIKIDTAPFSQQYSELTRKEKDSFVYAGANLSPHITNIDELIRILNARFAIEDDEQDRIANTPMQEGLSRKTLQDKYLDIIASMDVKTLKAELIRLKSPPDGNKKEGGQAQPSATLAKITERLKELLRYYGVNYNKAEGAAKTPDAPKNLIGVALGWFIAMKLVNNLINPMLKEEDITPVQRDNSLKILNKINADFTKIKDASAPPPATPAPATPAPAA